MRIHIHGEFGFMHKTPNKIKITKWSWIRISSFFFSMVWRCLWLTYSETLIFFSSSSLSAVFVCTEYRSYQIGSMHDSRNKMQPAMINKRVVYFQYQIRRVAVAIGFPIQSNLLRNCWNSNNGNQFIIGKTIEWVIGADILDKRPVPNYL